MHLIRFPRSRGFTLLELLVVLVIAAMLMAVTPPLISRVMPGVELRSATRNIASALRYARSRAATSGSEATVRLDLENRRMTTTGRSRGYEIPKSLKIDLLTAESETEGDQIGAVRFYPDGGSTGGRVTLSLVDNEERRLAVDVDWLTGQIRVLGEEDAQP